jgi:hypothetical protein
LFVFEVIEVEIVALNNVPEVAVQMESPTIFIAPLQLSFTGACPKETKQKNRKTICKSALRI